MEEKRIKRRVSEFEGSSQRYVDKERTIKRSVRIPEDVHEALMEESRRRGKSGNQVILQVLGERYGIEVKERRKGRRWY